MARVGPARPVWPHGVKVQEVKSYESAALAGSAVKFAPAIAVSTVAVTTRAFLRRVLILVERVENFIGPNLERSLRSIKV